MIFIKGFLFGMTLQLSIGPVFFAVLHKSANKGFKEAFKMVCAVALVDAAYIITSFLGVANLLKIEVLKRSILFIGAFILVYFGIKHIMGFIKRKTGDNYSENKNNLDGSSFLYGIKLTVSNPITIIFWSGIFSSLIASGRLKNITQVFYYSTGCVLSTLLFLGFISAAGSFVSRYINIKVIKWLDLAVGVFLILFGIKMLIT